MRHHHVGLAHDEVGLYLGHLLRLAGTELPLFEDAALEAIHQATSRVLRMVSAYAHHSLNAAALAGANTVTIEHVQAASTEVS